MRGYRYLSTAALVLCSLGCFGQQHRPTAQASAAKPSSEPGQSVQPSKTEPKEAIHGTSSPAPSPERRGTHSSPLVIEESGFDWPAHSLAFVMVLVAGFQAWLFLRQLKLLDESTKHAGDAAIAARRATEISTETLHVSQRPWVGAIKIHTLFPSQRMEAVTCRVQLRNFGHTPAMSCIHQTAVAWCAPNEVETISFPPIQFEGAPGLCLFPEEEMLTNGQVTIGRDDLIELHRGRKALLLFVECRYKTTLSDATHTTKACFRARVQMDPGHVTKENHMSFIASEGIGRHSFAD